MWKHASRHACLARRAANHGHGPPPYGGSPEHHGRHLAQSLDGPGHESGYAGHGRCHDVPYLAGPFLAVLSHARAPYLSHAPSHARVPDYSAGAYVRDHVIGSGGHGPSSRACDHGYDCPIGCATDFAPCRGLPCHSVHARGAGEWGQKGKHDQNANAGESTGDKPNRTDIAVPISGQALRLLAAISYATVVRRRRRSRLLAMGLNAVPLVARRDFAILHITRSTIFIVSTILTLVFLVLALMLVVLAILHFWRRHRKKQRSRPKTAGSSDATGAVKGAYARTLDCQLGNAITPIPLLSPVQSEDVCLLWGSPFGGSNL